MKKIYRHKVVSQNSNFKINVARREFSQIPAHWHDFYEIEFCVGGSGTAEVNGKRFQVSRGTLFFLTPTDFHSFSSSDSIKIVNFSFAPYCIEYSGFSELLSITKCITCQLSEEKTQKILTLIDIAECEIKSEAYLSRKYVSHLLACVMIEILRLKKSSSAEDDELPVQKLIYYLHAHFKEDITLDSLAEFSNLSPGYISKTFRKHLGVGFKELLTDLRLRHAETLLLYSDESITDISYFSGFHSPTHFLRAFQKKHGLPPREFRKQNSNTSK